MLRQANIYGAGRRRSNEETNCFRMGVVCYDCGASGCQNGSLEYIIPTTRNRSAPDQAREENNV